jgi:hypothetical protein
MIGLVSSCFCPYVTFVHQNTTTIRKWSTAQQRGQWYCVLLIDFDGIRLYNVTTHHNSDFYVIPVANIICMLHLPKDLYINNITRGDGSLFYLLISYFCVLLHYSVCASFDMSKFQHYHHVSICIELASQ